MMSLEQHGRRHARFGPDALSNEDKEFEFDSVLFNTARQRLGYWDSFDGRALTSGASITTYERYQALRLGLAADGTTGRTFAQTENSTVAGDVAYLRAGTGFTPRAAEQWQFKAYVLQQTAPVGGTQDYYVGLRDGVATGAQNGIYFKSIDAANWYLFCRSAGVETTINLGVAPGTTLLLLELRILANGGQVRPYINGAPAASVGGTASIVANIPTGLLIPVIFHDNRAATVTTAGQLRCYGWGWRGDLIA